MAHKFAILVVAVTIASLLAGCVQSEGTTQVQSAIPGENNEGAVGAGGAESTDPVEAEAYIAVPGYIVGTVVDPELVPISEVVVSVIPSDLYATTNAAGSFKIGPLDEGTYTVSAEKGGYSPASVEAKVSDSTSTKVTLTIDPMASDVPYHETIQRVMHLFCAFSIRVYVQGAINAPLSAPCAGLIDILIQTATGSNSTNNFDEWTFNFKIEKPGFASLVMEMVWPPQQLGSDGVLQLTQLATAEAQNSGAVQIGGTVYGGSMAQPFHDMIHSGLSYWVRNGENVTFHPDPNATAEYQMIVAGYYGNTSVPAGESAVFIEWRPTVYLTMFYNRRAAPDFSILPEE